MPDKFAAGPNSARRVLWIVGLFVAIILGLVLYFRVQLDAAVGLRAFIGGEGLWAKAQKDALLSLYLYSGTRDEADYRAYLRLIRVPLGFQMARREILKAQPDWDVVRQGCRQGGLHPVDTEYAILLFRRFQNSAYLSRAIEHWGRGDELIAQLVDAAGLLHDEVASGRTRPAEIHALEIRLASINSQLRLDEDQFSATLGEASRWANDLSRWLTYVVATLFVALGIVLSLSIIRRIYATEGALVESEARFRGIFEGVSDAIYTIAADGTITSVSPSCERITGRPPGEFIGKPFASVVHPDDLLRAQDLFRDTLGGQHTVGVEVRIAHKSGEFIDVEHSVVPMRSGGQVSSVLGIARDITERKRLEVELRESEQRLRAILEATADGILVADAKTGKFVVGNHAICSMLGYSQEELTDIGVQDIHPAESLAEVQQEFRRQANGEIRTAQNIPVKSKSGQIFFADVSGAPISLGGRPHLVGVFHDVTDRKREEDESRRIAATDSLTGIANRRELAVIVEREIARAQRNGRAFSIVMYDIDAFKPINDSYGHAIGDEILRGITDIVKRNLRSVDVPARLSGDEFVILIADSDIDTVAAVAEKLRQAIAGHRFDQVGQVTASFGVTTFRPGDDMGSLMKRVDNALYAAKRNGHNRVERIA